MLNMHVLEKFIKCKSKLHKIKKKKKKPLPSVFILSTAALEHLCPQVYKPLPYLSVPSFLNHPPLSLSPYVLIILYYTDDPLYRSKSAN